MKDGVEIEKRFQQVINDFTTMIDPCICIVSRKNKLLYVYFDDASLKDKKVISNAEINISEESNCYEDDKRILEYLLALKATGHGTILICSLT